MKNFAKFVLAGGLLLAAGLAVDNASAQCHDGFHNYAAPSRFLQFRVDGRAFVFDRVSSGIFCDGVKIGIREPSGKVTLFGNLPAPAGGVAAVPGGIAATPGGVVAGGPAVAGASVPAAGGVVAGNPGVAGAPAAVDGAAPGGVPAGNAPGVAPAQSPAAVGGSDAPAPAPAPAPAAGPTAAVPSAVPALGSGNDPQAAAAVPPVPQVDISLLVGQWRAETKDIAGRVVVRELSFDEQRNATLRVQAEGQEPISIQGPFEMKNNQFVIADGEDKRELGQFTLVEKDRLVLQGEGETVNFTPVQELASAAE
jgi:hypothetical protein